MHDILDIMEEIDALPTYLTADILTIQNILEDIKQVIHNREREYEGKCFNL